jgi:hypothetical protein
MFKISNMLKEILEINTVPSGNKLYMPIFSLILFHSDAEMIPWYYKLSLFLVT